MTQELAQVHKDTISAFQRTPPVDVVGLADALGVSVWESTKLKNASGKLFRDPRYGGPSGYAILVNQSDPLVRKRFTIAHEIAHFLLHVGDVQGGTITDDEFYRSGLTSTQEAEANRLAAEILMPSHLIKDADYTPAKELAARLQVSELAMTIRTSALGKEQYL